MFDFDGAKIRIFREFPFFFGKKFAKSGRKSLIFRIYPSVSAGQRADLLLIPVIVPAAEAAGIA